MPKKWNVDAKPAEKLLALYSLLLFTGRKMSLTQLSEEFVCSKQAILRLIGQLEASSFGKLIREKQGRESFYSIARPERLPQITLSPEGLSHLALCRDFLLHLLPSSVQSTIGETLQQASAYTTQSASVPIFSSVGRSHVKGYIDYAPLQDIIQTTLKTIHEEKVCILHYKVSLHDDVKIYEFAPKLLVTRRDALFIEGWLVTEKGTPTPYHDSHTTFAVHRIQQIELTRRSSSHLLPIKEDSSAFGFMCGYDEPFSVTIRFDRKVATYVEERIWSEDQKTTLYPDGSLLLKMTTNNALELTSWVLGFGENAEVLEPRWLADSIELEIERLLDSYRKTKESLEELEEDVFE